MARCARSDLGTPSPDEDDDVFILEEQKSLSQAAEHSPSVGADNRFVKGIQERSDFFGAQGLALTSEMPGHGGISVLAGAVADLCLVEGASSQEQELPRIFFPDDFVHSLRDGEGSRDFLSREQCEVIGSFQRTTRALEKLRRERGGDPEADLAISKEVHMTICNETKKLSEVYLCKPPRRVKKEK